ncbi:MAG: non-heme iron oxygenase ferredoxin subunit [Chloroflexi bacterium]|nr:non-heme iron oxygenase ferredoxin subunit [Chloroflexota bacterium]
MSLTPIGTIHDIAPHQPLIVDLDYDTVVIFQVGEEYFCLEDVCSHQEQPLSDGVVEDCRVECPLHGSWFDLRTGKALNLPAVTAVKTFPVVVQGEQLLLEIPEPNW